MRKIFLAAFIMLLTITSYAQSDSVRMELDHIFQHIDKTQIPTGYLNEYGPVVVNKKWITGTLSDSNFIYDIDVFNLSNN